MPALKLGQDFFYQIGFSQVKKACSLSLVIKLYTGNQMYRTPPVLPHPI